MSEENDNPPRRRPARRNRSNSVTLASSFKQFVGNASSAEIQEFSSQLNAALSEVSLNDEQTSAGEESTAVQSSDQKENKNHIASQRRPSESEFYTPQPTSRRNSKAGEQLVASMKQTAADLLAELGDISDDDDDEKINFGTLGTLREESMRSL
ncbi:hypothetical protein ACHAWT_005552 [Skeletonema menzelii]|mmetsp:Transcript_25502/g.42085  ORF Transcript_25502/g.42085 Transcript_25502/m.42085 type:complete len:154 (-) Transcript_25502:136-597(-)